MARNPKHEAKPAHNLSRLAGSQAALLGLLCLVTLIVYGNTFGLGFALDPVALINGDPRIHAATLQNLGLIFQYDYWWPSSVDTLYRPVTTLSFLLNYAVLGNADNPTGYHVLNVVLHAINSLLVFELALRLFRSRKPAFFAACLWTVHPITTEAVANVAGRADLLAALWVLASLLLYIRIVSGVEGRWRWAILALFAASLCGCFSKESAAVLPALMLLWDITFGSGWRRGGARRLAAYGAVAVSLLLMVCARHWVFSAAPVPEMPFVDNPLRGAGFLGARWTAIRMAGMDLLLLLWPLALSSERGFAQIVPAAASDPGAWLALAAIAGILVVVLKRYRKDKLMFWSAGMFGLALLPVSNLAVLIGATMAERFLYLPSIAFAIAVAGLLERVKARALVQAALICALVLLAGRTIARNRDWQNNLTLAQADVGSAPRSARLREILASALFERDPVRNLDAAIREEETACEIMRPLPAERVFQQSPARLGAYYRMKGDAVGTPENRRWYEKSLSILRRAREASLAIEKNYDQAQVIRHKPLATRLAYQPVYLDLGVTLTRLGRNAEAIDAYRYGREIDPRTPATYDLMADAYLAQGERGRAAVTLLGKTLLLGTTAETMERLASAYGDGSCAIERGSGWLRLNEACPRVQADLCLAEADLVDLLQRARLPEPARQFAERAQGQGCPEAPRGETQ
jgi:tetratricopeptide (TPR) repeat protein